MVNRSFLKDKIQRRKLEYNLVDHCNLACRECSHLSPFQNQGSMSLSVFKRDLLRLSSVYHVDRFRFVGGEPLLHRSIIDFVAAVREVQIADFVEIVTNGTLLSRTSDEVLSAIDGLSVSWYPSSWKKNSTLDQVRSRCRRLGVRLKINRIDRFRKMQPQHKHNDDALVSKIFRSCLIANTWDCQTFYDGYFYLCSRPIYSGAYFRKVGVRTGDLRKIDGINLHEPNLRERLEDALQLKTPLESCRYCLGTSGKYVKWGQLSPEEKSRPVTKGDSAQADISFARMRYLLTWRKAEELILRLFPSVRLQRVLVLVRTATIRD